jgi:hypothetical protein
MEYYKVSVLETDGYITGGCAFKEFNSDHSSGGVLAESSKYSTQEYEV